MSFSLVLTHKNLGPESDHVISVSVDSHDSFSVEYMEKNSTNHSTHRFYMDFDWEGLLSYLDSVRHMLSRDLLPVEGIQVQIPGFPIVALSAFEFGTNSTHNALTNMIETYVSHVCV